MTLWSASSIGKRVSLLGVLAVSVWLLAGTPANGQSASAPATSTAPTKKTIQAVQNAFWRSATNPARLMA